MNKQELIDKYEAAECVVNFVSGKTLLKSILRDLKQLDEPEKVKVPQFVAKIIEYYKRHNATLYDALREKNFNKQYNEWLMNEQDAYNKVARAWLDGYEVEYEVEKEKRYWVKITAAEQYLVRVEDENFLGFLQSRLRSKFTRKQLEDAGFGWVFDCPGIEIEEVE